MKRESDFPTLTLLVGSIALLTGLALPVAARSTAEPGSTQEKSENGAPRVTEGYQRTIDRAWAKALDGETPAYACAGLKGRLASNDQAATDGGREALFACSVLAPVRYFETLLEQVDAGESTCEQFMTSFMTQLPGMTLSVESIRGMLAVDPEDSDAVAKAFQGVVDEATVQRGLTDPKAVIKERLAEPVSETCPDLAALMSD